MYAPTGEDDMSTPKKRSILQPSMTLKLPRRRAAAIGTSGIRVYRGGVTSAKWKLVSQRPKVQKINDTISIRANIAVNKGAERQSEMMVEISSEALLDLFETQFEVKGKGVDNVTSQSASSGFDSDGSHRQHKAGILGLG